MGAEDWMALSLCKLFKIPPSLFFPGVGEHHVRRAAKRICASCAVQDECLSYALNKGIKDGIWGGRTHLERRSIELSIKQSA